MKKTIDLLFIMDFVGPFQKEHLETEKQLSEVLEKQMSSKLVTRKDYLQKSIIELLLGSPFVSEKALNLLKEREDHVVNCTRAVIWQTCENPSSINEQKRNRIIEIGIPLVMINKERRIMEFVNGAENLEIAKKVKEIYSFDSALEVAAV